MPKVAAILLSPILVTLLLVGNAYGFLGGDLPVPSFSPDTFEIKNPSNIIKIESKNFEPKEIPKRYLIFGTGSINDLKKIENNLIESVNSQNGFFSVGIFYENQITTLKEKGYHVIEDFTLDFHQTNTSDELPEVSQIGKIVNSEKAFEKYNYTGAGITIAIVDTGVDFSNPDIQDSLARDENNYPIMLDADGQGIILTNATFIANIDKNGILRNFTDPIPEGITSSVYKTRQGVFLDINQKGGGTILEIYNSFFPNSGNAPVFNGTLSDDMKIGQNNRDYIVSQSKIYHLGIMYQGIQQGQFNRIQVVPVLVVDSEVKGQYDTIIPDLSTSWEDFTRFDLKPGQKPDYDFDFTDEQPIKLGNGNEFLIYDSNNDGKADYSAGTVGAHVLDVYSVISNKTTTLKNTIKAVNGTLLPPMDSAGAFFGVMTDGFGHGTSSAASITSKGTVEYDIYNNTKKYKIRGVAPGAKIVPIKALWFGDTVYAWLWAAGFDNKENKWEFEGQPKVDIISNSWGVSNFPIIGSGPGLDILSLILSVLVVPQSIDENYPGVTIVSSAGNSGHGYGTLGLPNASPYGITVGATSNNVYVGYGPFQNQPRFGNTTDHQNHVVDFSSRGPGIIGDPKPDIMSIGAYSFTPSSVTKMEKESKKEPFSMFGGTSMAAPLVSGSAAILMESMNQNFQNYNPLEIKNILMSTATDLYNDPLTQGSGLVNVYDAVQFVNGEGGIFAVHNDASFSNIKKILDVPLNAVNSTVFGIDDFKIPEKEFSENSWFAGRLLPGERSIATFTIENPTDQPIDIAIKPTTLKLIKKTKFNETTAVHLQDSILNETGTYIPNYVRLADVKPHNDLLSYFDYPNPIPDDASLMILNLNFPFDEFLNKTEAVFANDLKISSLYLYDWADNNNDTKIASNELSLVNRGGSWGTVQEIRVTEPKTEFEETPIVGIYPVPSRYSYWLGETPNNSTSMNYTLTSSYYKKDNWDLVWLDKTHLQVPPKSNSQITTTLVVPINYKSGIYQGFLTFEGDHHTVNVPVSFSVQKLINKTDTNVLIKNSNEGDILYGSGYVKGAFDMVNRYMSGDWRQYYFDIADETVNAGAFDIQWQNTDSNLSVFVIDPQGRVVQSNVPSGVFGHFMGWPTNDWLGTTPFSQGGGFFPVKNKDNTSTVLYAPINQTGTYTLLVHSTLFGGDSITEPLSVAAKFTTLSHDNEEPIINLVVPEFVNSTYQIIPEIIDENLDIVKYYLDGSEFNFINRISTKDLEEGYHELTITASDIVGQNSTQSFSFNVDSSLPELKIKSPRNGMTVSQRLPINFEVLDNNLLEAEAISIILPDGELITDETTVNYDTSNLEDGQYEIQIFAVDKAENEVLKTVSFYVDHNIVDKPVSASPEEEQPENQNVLLLIGISIGIAIGIGIFLLATKKNKISKTN